MNFDSELLPVARSAGILIAGVTPVGGIVSGSLAAMKLDGWTREDATLKAPAAIVVRWPDLAIDRSPSARLSVRLQEKRRDEAIEKLKNVFAEARAYAKAKAAEGKAGIPRHDDDPRLEALLPALDGSLPVIVVAQRVAQIRAALAWAKEENLKLVLAGARDGWRVADEIAKANVPVIVEQPLELPTRPDEAVRRQLRLCGRAREGGRARRVQRRAPTASSARNLPHQAAAAVAFGFPREKAVEAMTLEPARILGRRRPRRLPGARQGRHAHRHRRRHPGPAHERPRRLARRPPPRPDRQAETPVRALPQPSRAAQPVGVSLSRRERVGVRGFVSRAPALTRLRHMYRISVQVDPMASEVTYTDARARFAALCDEVAESRDPVIIHRRGSEDVALVSAAELRSLTETAHLLRSPRNARRLLRALRRARGSRDLVPQSVAGLRRAAGLEPTKR